MPRKYFTAEQIISKLREAEVFISQGKTAAIVGAHRQPIGQPFRGHTDWVSSVAFRLDGKTLASGTSDNSIILWDVATRQPIGQPLNGYLAAVFSLAFSSDGKTLASDSSENMMIAWDVDPESWIESICQQVGRNRTLAEWTQYFPNEEYRVTCLQWRLEPEADMPTPWAQYSVE